GAAEVAAVWASEAGEDHAGARHLAAEDAHAADDQRMAARAAALAEETLHEAGAFFAADVVAPGRELFVGEHGAVAAEDDLRAGRVAADERHRFLHPMKGGEHEREADVVRLLSQLADQLALRWIVKHRGRRFDVFCDVSERELDVVRARRKETLRARDLAIQQLVADARRIAVSFTERAADTGKQNFWHKHQT